MRAYRKTNLLAVIYWKKSPAAGAVRRFFAPRTVRGPRCLAQMRISVRKPRECLSRRASRVHENRGPAIRRLPEELSMQERRAREILQSLIQGLDPFSGEELPAGTVFQNADVLRALLAGVAAMEQEVARASRRAQLPRNIGRTWSADEHADLIDAFQAGQSAAEIAAKHGRTVRAIEARLEKLGLITPSERTTMDRFGTNTPG
jgi:hypothetical protein